MRGGEKLIQHKGMKNGEGSPNSFEGIFSNWRGRVEADAAILQDGNVAILHGRDFGQNLEEIENMDLSRLQTLTIPTANSEETGRKVLLLKEFVGLASDAGTAISLELKSNSVEKAVELAKTIVAQLAGMKKAGGLKDNEQFLEKGMAFESFSVSALKTLKETGGRENLKLRTTLYWPADRAGAERNSLFEVGVLENVENKDFTWPELGIEVAFDNGMEEIEFQPEQITPELVERAHAKGLGVNSGLIKEKKQIDYLINIGVDHILTE